MKAQTETAQLVHDLNSPVNGVHEYNYELLMEYEPKPIPLFVPDNGAEQKELFLRGDIENPQHMYSGLDKLDFDQMYQGLHVEAATITKSAAISPKYKDAYTGVIDDFMKKTEFLRAAYDYKHATTAEDRAEASQRYMDLNIDLYRKPDEAIYRSMLAGKLRVIDAKHLTGRAAELREELHAILPERQHDEGALSRFKPSEETIAWMQEVVKSLYGNLLQHVPDQDKFTVYEIRDLFNQIIDEEFGESASGWKTVVQTATSFNVRVPEKEIIIPVTYPDKTYAQVRKLIVHEIGVHMPRSLMGEQTDADPLRHGVAGSYDSEEGLGVVMEQALEGKYIENGMPSYIVAGAAYYDNMDFRQLFEMEWRISLLENLSSDDISDGQIDKKRSAIYNIVFRIMRGSDDLPWFKDLAYFNGANDIWKHLESISGDDTEFAFVLASGKTNPANKDDRRLAREVRTP